jgi:probable HAF family extracellular repeat protein
VRRRTMLITGAAVVVALAAGAVGVVLSGGSAGASGRWVIQDLGTLGGRGSVPYDMNERGQVVGVSDTSLSSHAFLWQGGKMVDLGAFGGTYSSAEAINESGEIVGLRIPDPAVAAMDDGYPYKAFPVLWRKGHVTPLPTLTVPGCDGNIDWDWLLGIDARSRVVGTINVSTESSGCQRAAVWDGGRWHVLRGVSRAAAFNQRGQIIGTGTQGGGSVIWEEGATTELGTLGGNVTEARAINERGEIVGWSEMAAGASHAVLWQDGKLTDLGTLGGKRSWAAAINERGQIAGTSETTGGVLHAFVWQHGKLTDLGALGGKQSMAAAINGSGQIVGSSEIGGSAGRAFAHAFLWQSGKMVDLGTLGGKKSQAILITERGQILGYSTTSTGASHAVLWTLREG